MSSWYVPSDSVLCVGWAVLTATDNVVLVCTIKLCIMCLVSNVASCWLWCYMSQAILVAQITYAGPSWRGFIKSEETAHLKAVMLKARRFGYLPTDFLSLDDLLDSSDESLFRSIRYNPQHVLHQLLPPPKHTDYNLRSHGHGLTLSVIPSEFMRKNFINRMLFNDDIY